jgi:uncharacterized protein (DUF885 family)
VTRAEVERDPIAYIQHIDGVLAATSQQVADFREEVSREFVSVRGEIARVDEKLSQFRTETQAEFAAARSEIADLRTEMRGELANLRTEMRGEMAEIKAAIVQVLAWLPQPPSNQ